MSFRDDGLMPENTEANCWLRACALPCGVVCSSPCVSVRFVIPNKSCLVCFTKLQNFLFAACIIALTRCYYIFQIFPVILPYFLLGLVFQISVSILVVLISCPALSLLYPVSLSDLPHGFPAYPWFLIGRPGCFVRDEFRCTTENSLLKRIPCVINCCRRCALCHEVIVKLNHVFMVAFPVCLAV